VLGYGPLVAALAIVPSMLTVRWIGAAAGTMVLGVIIHSGGGGLTPGAGCIALLRDGRAGS
jgi:hypothetical protein